MSSAAPIARRSFTVGGAGGSPIELLIYAPVQGPDDFTCHYELKENGNTVKARDIFGIDSLQALVLALQLSTVDIMFSAPGIRRDVYWLGENTDLGLVMPEPTPEQK